MRDEILIERLSDAHDRRMSAQSLGGPYYFDPEEEAAIFRELFSRPKRRVFESAADMDLYREEDKR